ncbi:MAG: nucleotide exchange factor GrpE [Candidatus Micrarchaeota archaeon]
MAEEAKDQKKDDTESKQDQAAKEAKQSSAEEGKESKEEEKLVSEKEYLELKDRLLRLAAEFDNYKKRTAKENENAKLLGKAELMRKLLPTLDEFELALSVSSKENKEIKGFEMIFSNLLDALKSEGLEVIETNGKYDPYKHEIILTKESDKEEGSILEVVRKGYMLNGILLRPATVIVAKAKSEPSGEAEGKNKK